MKIYANLAKYIEGRLIAIEKSHEDPLKKLLLKKEVLEILRVRAFRHKNCFNNFLEAISLQEGFSVQSTKAYVELINLFSGRNMQLRKIPQTEIYCFATGNLTSDEKFCNLFCQTNANTSRNLSQDALVIFNDIPGLSEELSSLGYCPQETEPSSILSEYCNRSDKGIITLVTKSGPTKRGLTHLITEIGGISLEPDFEFVTLIKKRVTATQYRNQVFHSMTTICTRILELNLNGGFIRNDLDPNIMADVYHAIYLAASFVYEFLLEVQFPSPEVQELYVRYVSPCTEWLSSCFSNIMENPSYSFSWFNVSYTLETMNALFALKSYEKPQFTPDQTSILIEALIKFERAPFSAALAHNRILIVDQTRALLSKIFEDNFQHSLSKNPSVKFPDHLFLEQKGYMPISSICSGKKILYKCLDRFSRKLVIIKRLAKPKDALNRNIDGEISMLMTLQHTNIVRYLNYFEDERFWFLAMEYCDDTVNRRPLNPNGTIEEMEVCSIGRQILSGLYYLGRNHIVHRDIKPGNILKDGRGFIKIADFGEAQLIPLPDESKQASLLGLPGTPAYMAPECLHQASVHQSADVWSLACVLAYLLSGQHPWSECNNDYNILYTMGSSDRGPYDIGSLKCSEEMKRVLRDMLNRDPLARPNVGMLMAESIFVNVPECVI